MHSWRLDRVHTNKLSFEQIDIAKALVIWSILLLSEIRIFMLKKQGIGPRSWLVMCSMSRGTHRSEGCTSRGLQKSCFDASRKSSIQHNSRYIRDNVQATQGAKIVCGMASHVSDPYIDRCLQNMTKNILTSAWHIHQPIWKIQTICLSRSHNFICPRTTQQCVYKATERKWQLWWSWA